MIFAIDTSSSVLSVAIKCENQPIIQNDIELGRNQSVYVLDYINEIVDNQLINGKSISLKDISTVLIGAGPGSFTGLRIGASIAHSIRLVNKAPIISLPNFLVMAYMAYKNVPKARLYLVAIPAKINHLYFAKYSSSDILHPNGIKDINAEKLIRTEQLGEVVKSSLQSHEDISSFVFIGESFFYTSFLSSYNDINDDAINSIDNMINLPINYPKAFKMIEYFLQHKDYFIGESPNDKIELRYVGHYL